MNVLVGERDPLTIRRGAVFVDAQGRIGVILIFLQRSRSLKKYKNNGLLNRKVFSLPQVHGQTTPVAGVAVS